MHPVSDRLIRDPDRPGAFVVVSGPTSQSWVDPADPTRLEFEYVQRIAEALRETVLARPPDERVRIVHVGGGGLTIPRFVEAVRPHTAQIVLEPDADLIAEVRRTLPLPRQTGIKIRELDGVTGLTQMPDAYADAIIVDAFAGAQVPAELATDEFFGQTRRLLREGGVMLMNLTDKSPFAWARRCVAGIETAFRHLVVSAEIPVWKGRRFGNLVAVAGLSALPIDTLEQWARRAQFPYRLQSGRDLRRWIGAATPFTETESRPSPDPGWGRGWFS